MTFFTRWLRISNKEVYCHLPKFLTTFLVIRFNFGIGPAQAQQKVQLPKQFLTTFFRHSLENVSTLTLKKLQLQLHNSPIDLLQLQITFCNCRNCDQLHVKICPAMCCMQRRKLQLQEYFNANKNGEQGGSQDLQYLLESTGIYYYLFPITYFILSISSYIFPNTYVILPIFQSLFPINYFLIPISYYLFPITYFLFPLLHLISQRDPQPQSVPMRIHVVHVYYLIVSNPT